MQCCSCNHFTLAECYATSVVERISRQQIKILRILLAWCTYTFARFSRFIFKLFYFFRDHRSAKFVKPLYQEWEGLEHDEDDDDDNKKHSEAEVTYVCLPGSR